MKQTYKKPIARLEYFALSQSIASTCAPGNSEFGQPSHDDKNSCGWQIDEEIFWLASGEACTVPTDENAIIEGVCYHNPEGGAFIFGS